MVKLRFCLLLVSLLVMSGLCGGCSNNRNRQALEDIDLIRVIGIDYEKDSYSLSVLFTEASTIYQGHGGTVYEAYEQLKRSHKKPITLSQTGYFFLGEKACEQGIDKALSFFLNHEATQINALTFVTRELDAYEFMSEGLASSLILYDEFDSIEIKQSEWYKKNENTLSNIYKNVLEKKECILIPYAGISENEYEVSGYTVILENKLFDYLTYEQSLGVDIFKNKMNSYPIFLEQASLRIIKSKTAIEVKYLKEGNINTAFLLQEERQLPEQSIGAIQLDIFVRFESEVVEFLEQGLTFELLRPAQSAYITELVMESIDYAMVTGADILNLEGLLKRELPDVYENIKSKDYVSLLCKGLEANICVEGKIKRSFMDLFY